jgi:hypothetical protein
LYFLKKKLGLLTICLLSFVDASSTSDSEDSQTTSSSSGMAGAMATVAPAALAGGAFIALFM